MLWLLVALLVWGALIYNEFLHRQSMIEAAWHDLQLQLAQPDQASRAQAIHDATQYHNALVRDYNTKLRFIPDRFIATAAKFTPKTLYAHGQ